MTSSGSNDSGMFETNLHDERFLPFEGAGVISTWKLELPSEFRQFDYNTISDVVIHMHYTARQGGDQLKEKTTEYLLIQVSETDQWGLTLQLTLKQFQNEWSLFASGAPKLEIVVKKNYFPYFTNMKNKNIRIDEVKFIQSESMKSSNLKQPTYWL
ncbi:hypothetical protein PAENIP36_37730 [Paenibacillus sp. P36]